MDCKKFVRPLTEFSALSTSAVNGLLRRRTTIDMFKAVVSLDDLC